MKIDSDKPSTSNVILEIKDLTKDFGGLIALNEVKCAFVRGEIAGIIGPNGAGKTTLFNAITGFLPLNAGHIMWENTDILGKRPDQISNLGIARTFQIPKTFDGETVFENILMSFHANDRDKDEEIIEKGLSILKSFGLNEAMIRNTLAQNLTYGQKKVLGIVMALMCYPKLLLLDEPVASLSIEEARRVSDIIKSLFNEGIDICIIEHNMKFLMELVHKVIVLHVGKVIATGTPMQVQNNEDVIAAYLGGKKSDSP